MTPFPVPLIIVRGLGYLLAVISVWRSVIREHPSSERFSETDNLRRYIYINETPFLSILLCLVRFSRISRNSKTLATTIQDLMVYCWSVRNWSPYLVLPQEHRCCERCQFLLLATLFAATAIKDCKIILFFFLNYPWLSRPWSLVLPECFFF